MVMRMFLPGTRHAQSNPARFGTGNAIPLRMERVALLEHLAHAELHVAQSERLVSRQRR